ncbi:MAG: carbohydrate porin [Candidatus Omnitrophica bacterium]|nr:carbohydrate porin [Candidatus Omnitrophota bacterium]
MLLKLTRTFAFLLSLLILAPTSKPLFADEPPQNLLQEIKMLQEKTQILKTSIEELKNENEALKSKSQIIAEEWLAIKGTAQGTEIAKKLEEKVSTLGNKIGTIKISGDIVGIVQSSVNQRIHPGIQANTLYVDDATGATLQNNFGESSEDRTIGAGCFNLFLESQILENTTVFADIEANSPNQVISPILSQPNSNSTVATHLSPQNLDVMNFLELYVESQWYNKRLTTTVGKIYLSDYFDQNAIAHDDKNQFLGYAFYNNLTFASVEPYYTLGARASLDIGWGLTAQAGVASQDDSAGKLFNALFGIFELDYNTAFFFGKEGNYRAYGYVKDIDDIDTTAQHAGLTGESSNAIGAGISVDQKLTDKFTAFSRLGWNEAKLAITTSTLDGVFPAVSSSISFGGAYNGLLPNRPDDVLGGGWALTNPSDPFGTFPERPDNEYFMEFYYSYKVREGFHVSPILQFVKHPNGDDDENWITIFGGRAYLEF